MKFLIFFVFLFLNCGPSENLVYSADLLSDLSQPDINCPSTKEPTIVNIQTDPSDILFVGSRRDNSGNYLKCDLRIYEQPTIPKDSICTPSENKLFLFRNVMVWNSTFIYF